MYVLIEYNVVIIFLQMYTLWVQYIPLHISSQRRHAAHTHDAEPEKMAFSANQLMLPSSNT